MPRSNSQTATATTMAVGAADAHVPSAQIQTSAASSTQVWNETFGTARSPGSSISKYCRFSNLNWPATRLLGKEFDHRVQVPDRAVVVAARHLDLAFETIELLLQLDEVGAGLQVRISLGHGKQPAEPDRKRTLCLGARLDVAGRHRLCGGPEARDLVENSALMARIALHGLDQVGDEVGAALQLHVYAAPCFLAHLPGGDQPVVDRDHIDRDQHQDARMIHRSSITPSLPPPAGGSLRKRPARRLHISCLSAEKAKMPAEPRLRRRILDYAVRSPVCAARGRGPERGADENAKSTASSPCRSALSSAVKPILTAMP